MERRVTVPQFILEEKLNEGATTTVYRAHQSVLERTVLLKILHKHLIDDSTLAERFRREARACALIRSEYIVQVYDLTEIDGAPAIVMEYVEGRSLKDLLASDGPVAPETAKQFVIEILNALRAAHARGVIHRDIKPGNILVTEAGHIKVTDFGLAAIAVSQTVTMDGAVLGTPAYLPPEHIRGEAADERSDLFSLGATFIEMLTGQRIFEGASYSACINMILRFDVASVDGLVADAECAEVIKHLMHPDREQRFASAGAALEALYGTSEAARRPDTVEKQEPPSSAVPGTAAPMPERRLTRTRLAVGLLASLALAGALVWFMLRVQDGTTERDGAQSPPAAAETAQHAVTDTAASRSDALAQRNTDRGGDAPVVPARTDISGAKPPVRDSANLVVTCTPWAKVYVDNLYLGETPLGGAVAVKAGTRTITFTNPEFLPIVKSVDCAPGAQLAVSANFFESAGYLVVTVIPWAEVFIDDQYRDTTPREKPIIVTAGKRRLRLHNPGFADIVADIVVPKNDTLRLSYSLTGKR